MRFLSLIVAICFSMNVLASTGLNKALEEALDSYQYTMTVEWDQKDKDFYEKKTNEFYRELQNLMNQGLTKKDVMDLLNSKVKNKTELDALRLKAELAFSKSANMDDLARLLSQDVAKMYSTGASWEAYYLISGAFVAGLVALLVYSIWFNANHVCVETATVTQCGWYSQYQGGPEFYECWPQQVCTRYEEK